MNPDLQRLQAYPFEKLRQLFANLNPDASKAAIALSIGEPKHAAPQFVLDTLVNNLYSIGQYPATAGTDTLRNAICQWLQQRFGLTQVGHNNVIPVNGTREALFAIAQACVDRSANGYVVYPNPFYQIYEGATLLAGATPLLVDCDETTGLADYQGISEAQWQRTQLVYLCSPNNPTGAVMPMDELQWLINKAQQYNFVIAADECYSEIYYDEAKPPVGLLEAAAKMGNHSYQNCLVFHSLSKRSNLPGLRSGFVAGDAELIANFLRYRTYHGCSMSVPTQLASAAAWQDEQHVQQNRELYRQKFDTFAAVLQPSIDIHIPEASFYLWPKLPISGELFAQRLYAEQNIVVLPSAYLARENNGYLPAADRVRMALVAELEVCKEAAERIKTVLDSL